VAVRSIIDVVVNTGAFQRFAALYARYQQTLAPAVQSWNQINTKVASAASSSKTLQASSASTASSWRTIASHTASVASSLKSATDSLLRWTSISTIVGGLLGVGSLFGLDRLALGVGAGRREATGVGTTYGQQTAFNLSYGRFVDHSFLGRISDAASDPTKSWILRRLGATPQTLAAGNSADIARQILPALEKFAKTTDISKLGLLARALHYTDIISEEELKRLRASQPGELAAQGPKYGARLEAFKRTGTTEEQYQSFAEKLEEAGETIKNTFVIGLQPVIPKLTELSGALTNILVRFLKEIKPADIELLATKIGEFATYLGSPEFKEKLDKFINGMEELGDSLLKWAERLHLVSAPAPTPYEARTTHVAGRPGVLGSFIDAVTDPGQAWENIKRGDKGRVPNTGALGVPSVFGNVNNPNRLPAGGYAPASEESANGFRNSLTRNMGQSLVDVKNASDMSVYFSIQSQAGASTPKAVSMVGWNFGPYQ
jgi:hypothetical protein